MLSLGSSEDQQESVPLCLPVKHLRLSGIMSNCPVIFSVLTIWWCPSITNEMSNPWVEVTAYHGNVSIYFSVTVTSYFLQIETSKCDELQYYGNRPTCNGYLQSVTRATFGAVQRVYVADGRWCNLTYSLDHAGASSQFIIISIFNWIDVLCTRCALLLNSTLLNTCLRKHRCEGVLESFFCRLTCSQTYLWGHQHETYWGY